MSGRVKARGRASQADMAQKALADYEEVQRRQYHQQIRVDLVDRGAIRESVEKQLEEAAPRFREKGWKVTDA